METRIAASDGVPWYCLNYFPQALFGRNTPNTFSVHQPSAISKHQSQPSPPGDLASTFPKHPRPSKFPRTVPNLPAHPLFQAPIPTPPTRQPRKHFSQAPPPSKLSGHRFQAADASSFPSSAPNQMSESFLFLAHATFLPSLRIAPCNLQPTLKKILTYCQGTKVFHAEGICNLCRQLGPFLGGCLRHLLGVVPLVAPTTPTY